MWNRIFFAGSLLASTSQGWMLGAFVMGLSDTWYSTLFSIAIALTLPAIYIMLGCGWLLVKTSGTLYKKTQHWARWAILPMG